MISFDLSFSESHWNRAQALGLSLVFWIWHRGLFAAWAPRVMAASMIQNGVVIPCHSSSFPARIPMAPCFPTFHKESWKQRLRDPTVFVGSLQRILLPFAPRNVISAFIRLRSGKRQKTGCCFVDHELTPIYPPGTPQTECSSEGLSIKWVELIGNGLTQVSNAASLSVIVWWLSCSKMPPSIIQDMDYSFLLILIHLKFYMLM